MELATELQANMQFIGVWEHCKFNFGHLFLLVYLPYFCVNQMFAILFWGQELLYSWSFYPKLEKCKCVGQKLTSNVLDPRRMSTDKEVRK